MIDLLKAELEQIKAQKMQIFAHPMMAQLNGLIGAEKAIEKLIAQIEKKEGEVKTDEGTNSD